MVYRSKYPDLYIQKCNILSYIFPRSRPVSEKPVWIDAADTSNFLSPRQLLSWVRKLGSGLDKLGIGQQDVVLIFTPNTIFVPVAYLGIVGSGRIYSAANSIYTVDEVAYQLRDTSATCLLVHPELVKTAKAAASRVGLDPSKIFQFSDRHCSPVEGVRDWREALAGSQEEANAWQWDEMQNSADTTIATINYSSGSTGLPKGVCISHYNLITNVEQMIVSRQGGHTIEARLEERWVGFLPLYHAYGQIFVNIMAACLLHPTFVMRKFEYEPFLQIIQDHKITSLQIVPPVLIMFEKRPETKKYDLSSVVKVVCGAAPVAKDLQNRVSKMFKTPILQAWGMTESTSAAMVTPADYPYDDTGTVGVLMPNVLAKLLDEEGKEVGLGEPGELYIKGPSVCLGYWRNEQATKETLQDSWLKTGDVCIARKRDDGDHWFWIVDRKKEMIKVNALQVAPAELEARLLENEHIADAAVASVTLDSEEWPRGYVALKPESKGKVTEQQIQKWFKTQVAKHKQLAGGIRFVDEIPKLALGKIYRKVLRDWAKRDAQELEKTLKPRL